MLKNKKQAKRISFGLAVIILLLVCSMFTFAETGRKYVDGVALQTTIITKTLSGAQSNYELLKDTDIASGRSYFIDRMIFSSLAANSLYLNDSGTNADVGCGYFRVPANSTIIVNDINLKLQAACGLYVTTTAAGEIQIDYHLE